MFILRLIIAALIVSYIIWLFYTRIMGKSLSFSKVVSWVLLATFLIFISSYRYSLSLVEVMLKSLLERTNVFRVFCICNNSISCIYNNR